MDSTTPRKKPRLDIENVEPFGDEAWELTEDQLEALDILASQAITHDDQEQAPAPLRKVTHDMATPKKNAATTPGCHKPTAGSESAALNRSGFSSSLFAPVEQQKKLYQKPTCATYPKANVVNTYNPYVPHKATKVSEASLLGIKSLAGAPIQSKDITIADAQRQSQGGGRRSHELSVNLVRRSSNNSFSSIKVEEKLVDSSSLMLKKLQEELVKCKDEVKSLTQDQDAKVGEVKLLRESLSRIEAELDHERQERSKLIAKQSEKYEADLKVLQETLNKAKTELAFMKQELLDRRTRCQQLELKLKQCSIQETTTPRYTSAGVSFSQKKVSPPKPNNFLSRFSFDKTGPVNQNKSVSDASVQVDALPSTDRSRRKKMQLRTKLHKGVIPGGRVMTHLLHVDAVRPNDPLGGIVSFLHVSSAKDVLLNEMDRKMSPLSSHRVAALHSAKLQRSSSPEKDGEGQTTLSAQHLAVQGMEQLLRSGSQEVLATDSAATLLPLIEDRVIVYRDVVRFFADSQGLASVTSSLSSCKSSSLESYFSSLSCAPLPWLSNVQLTTAMVEQVETMVVVALVILHKLISLRPFLLPSVIARSVGGYDERGSKTKDEARTIPMDTRDTNQDKLESSPSSRTCLGNHPGTSPTKTGIDFIEHLICTTHVSLAVDELLNPDIVTAFLDVLLAMVQVVGECMAARIKWLFVSGTFNNCFRAKCNERIVVLCLRLAEETVRHSTASSSWLCGGYQDACFLYQLSILCQNVHTTFKSEARLRVILQLFRFLSTMVSTYRRLAPVAQDSDTCGNCSKELLVNLICVFNKEVLQYRNITAIQTHVVRDGIHLLHQLMAVDGRFSERRAHSEKQYVTLVCKIARLMNQCKDKFLPFEVNIIQELKDFESDDDDPESDAENETSMETGAG